MTVNRLGLLRALHANGCPPDDEDAEGERRFTLPINPDPVTRRLNAERAAVKPARDESPEGLLAPEWLSEAVAETAQQVTGLFRPGASELFADALWRRIREHDRGA